MDGVEARETIPLAYDVAGPREDAARFEAGAASEPTIVDPAEHNVVFTNLVKGDHDIVGLVAYSIYKQNKYDWLQAYSRHQGRMPNAEEAQAYLLGESTPRRLATYRHLAEAVLEGRGPDVPGAARETRREGAGLLAAPGRSTAARRGPAWQIGSSTLIVLGLALVALIVLFWLLRSGAPLPPPTPAR